jgi:predicted helicase
VWYTPPEIVQYQVARVDAALREELDIPDGLADPHVFVLDPCCGTGAYLVEVLRKIGETLSARGGGEAMDAADVKKAAQERVFGFELLPAPFVVAHLQMGLLLQNLAVPLDDSKNERAGIFLTNALTGWDFAGENPKLANWPELEAERKGAGQVKQEKPILVILGNPPYNAYAGISPVEEQGLVEPYKKGLVKEWGIKKFNLDDLYVRFFRIAERKIAEHNLPNEPRQGIVSFISNHSWISDPSFVVMRQHLLKSFDRIWVENLHGNRKISEYAPDGRTSETIFALQGFSAGIQQGVATSLLVRTGKKRKPLVLFRDDLNEARAADRRAQMLASLKAKKFDTQYEKVEPSQDNRFRFRSSDVAPHYLEWPCLTGLCAVAPSNGLMEKRGGALIDTDRAALEKRMRSYYDPNVSWDELKTLKNGLTDNAARFDAKKARVKVTDAEDFEPDHLRRYALRPFDTRFCYYSSERPLWNEPRPTLWRQCWSGNSFLMSRPAGVASPEGFPLFYTPLLGDNDFLRGHAYYFPLRLRITPTARPKKKDGNGEFGSILHEAAPAYKAGKEKTTANLSPASRAYLATLGIKNPDDEETASLIWMHALAIGYSPAYLAENADGVRQDWPRIPLPESKAALLASTELGSQVAALLDTETPVTGVDAGKIRPELVKLAVVTRLTKEPLNLSLTAGWGHAGKGGVTMPGKGRLETSRCAADEVSPLLGESTHDVYLNNAACWRNVPEKVWDYTIGGYQVIKKWLSYREFALLGRALTPDEAREVTHMARRIAALILLQPELDANYLRVKAKTFDWKT